MKNNEWENRYQADDTPWDQPAASDHLQWAIDAYDISPCKVLDIGCGTGTDVIWLAQQGFDATGVDISECAVGLARAKADTAGAACNFLMVDFLSEAVSGGPFDLAFDCGCFHTFDTEESRARFAASIARQLAPAGLWLSLIGSADTPPRDMGPPQVSAREITQAVEENFEILRLEAGRFRNDTEQSFNAWRCIMRKRV